MYAVIQTGGKQYRVAVGDKLKIETLVAEPGDSVELDQVLMISDNDNVQVGTPLLEGQSVSAEVVDNGRGEKIKVFKMHRRQGYRRTQGHRQNYTEIEITAIAGQASKDSGSTDEVKAAKSAKKEPVKAEMKAEKQDAAPVAAASDTDTAAQAPTEQESAVQESAVQESAVQESVKSASSDQSKVDDLTEISGIGPVISKKLNKLGYTSFVQIADLDEAGVAEIEEQLSFKGRIEREDWIKQAAELSK